MAISNINSLSLAGAAAPGLSFITSGTATGATSLSVNNAFSATYENYEIIINLVATADVTPTLRLRVGGVDASGANYGRMQFGFYGTTASVTGSFSQTSWVLGAMGASEGVFYTLRLYRPALAVTTHMDSLHSRYPTGSSGEGYIHTGGHSVSTAYDGFTFAAGSNFTATARVYGYRNS